MTRKNIKRQTYILYLVSVLIILFSVWGSIELENWQWFSRSGSLIVVLGIYLTSSQIIENSRRLRQRYRSVHKEGNFQRDWADDKHEHILRYNRIHEEETWVMGKCGFNLLIVGTLIWGFGDLAYFLI